MPLQRYYFVCLSVFSFISMLILFIQHFAVIRTLNIFFLTADLSFTMGTYHILTTGCPTNRHPDCLQQPYHQQNNPAKTILTNVLLWTDRVTLRSMRIFHLGISVLPSIIVVPIYILRWVLQISTCQ